MISIDEYLELREKIIDENSDDHNKLIEFNNWLIDNYPFLEISDDHSLTWFDDIPKGWAKSFGLDLCNELKEELIRCNFLKEYKILQIKEKWGELRWYDGGLPLYGDRLFIDLPEGTYVSGSNCKVWEMIDKYTNISRLVCIDCGNKAEYISTGWISPYCESCAHKLASKNDGREFNRDFVRIDSNE